MAERNTDESVSLYNASGQKIMPFDSIQVKHYFTHYNKIFFNKVVDENNEYIDSVFAGTPNYSIELLDNEGKTILSEIWKIKIGSVLYEV